MKIDETYFIYINIAIVAIYLGFIITGFVKGLVYELASIFYTLFSVAIAWFVSPVLASTYPIVNLEKISSELAMLSKFFDANSLLDTIIYFVIIFLLLKVVYVLLSIILKKFNDVPVLGGVNRLLGGVVGFINGTLVILAISLLLSLPIFKNGSEIKEKTFFKYVETISKTCSEYIIDKIDLNKYVVDETFDVDTYRDQLKDWLLNSDRD